MEFDSVSTNANENNAPNGKTQKEAHATKSKYREKGLTFLDSPDAERSGKEKTKRRERSNPPETNRSKYECKSTERNFLEKNANENEWGTSPTKKFKKKIKPPRKRFKRGDGMPRK